MVCQDLVRRLHRQGVCHGRRNLHEGLEHLRLLLGHLWLLEELLVGHCLLLEHRLLRYRLLLEQRLLRDHLLVHELLLRHGQSALEMCTSWWHRSGA